MKILIRGLSKEVTQAELKHIFLKFGRVDSVLLVLDRNNGKSKGFGFIEMPNDLEAEEAIKSLNATEINGEKVRVKTAIIREAPVKKTKKRKPKKQ